MPNMSYCRFENTFSDLCDCHDHMDDDDLPEAERKFRLLAEFNSYRKLAREIKP